MYSCIQKSFIGFLTTFQSNALSHYVIIRELDSLITSGCVIWTSSVTGQRYYYDPSDVQGHKSEDPYGSSKYLVNLISNSVNKQSLVQKSFICDPGTFNSNITAQIMPWPFAFLTPIIYRLMQPFCRKLTCSPPLASNSLVYVFENQESLPAEDVKVSKNILSAF